VDLIDRHIGDVMDLTSTEARLLIAEGWAAPDRRVSTTPAPPVDRRIKQARRRE
jgi:hypothetical protein